MNIISKKENKENLNFLNFESFLFSFYQIMLKESNKKENEENNKLVVECLRGLKNFVEISDKNGILKEEKKLEEIISYLTKQYSSNYDIMKQQNNQNEIVNMCGKVIETMRSNRGSLWFEEKMINFWKTNLERKVDVGSQTSEIKKDLVSVFSEEKGILKLFYLHRNSFKLNSKKESFLLTSLQRLLKQQVHFTENSDFSFIKTLFQLLGSVLPYFLNEGNNTSLFDKLSNILIYSSKFEGPFKEATQELIVFFEHKTDFLESFKVSLKENFSEKAELFFQHNLSIQNFKAKLIDTIDEECVNKHCQYFLNQFEDNPQQNNYNIIFSYFQNLFTMLGKLNEISSLLEELSLGEMCDDFDWENQKFKLSFLGHLFHSLSPFPFLPNITNSLSF
eukprot:TRINITY_DN7487_c0_g1_i1.p1 TRINITY_DN7487_c0_g1~~TRINITY_DN7487_c0_g1_i1.p1  ORF type:complete len:446 (-),score=138.75 TRINITY_DN7487_c0_g1_i1:29-1204(-)